MNHYILISLMFLVLLILSGFFSGSETAFFSINANKLQKIKKSKKQNLKLIAQLLKNPQQLLITIIIGNTIVNVSIASIAAIITHNLAKSYNLNHEFVMFIDVVVVTLTLLIVSEIIPKVFAVENNIKFAKFTSLPLYVFYILITPISYFVHLIINQFQQSVLDQTNKALTQAEMKTLVELGAEKGTLEREETEMLTSLFEFSETVVKEIMCPRPDMVCLESSQNFQSVMETVTKRMYSRIPVYKDKIDEIVGIMYIKSLLPFVGNKSVENFSLSKTMHSPFFVPESKKIQELLKEFQQEKIHMAIVVDEYGAVQGLITLEDIIEEIVGEIKDEYDKEEILFKKVSENKYLASGKFDLDDASDALNLEFNPDDEDIETLGGFLLNSLQNIPQENDHIDFKGYRFIVTKVIHNRIEKIEIIKLKKILNKEKHDA